jgi:hypothetical protein
LSWLPNFLLRRRVRSPWSSGNLSDSVVVRTSIYSYLQALTQWLPSHV